LLALPFRPVTAGVLYLPASFLLFRQKFGLYVMPGTRHDLRQSRRLVNVNRSKRLKCTLAIEAGLAQLCQSGKHATTARTTFFFDKILFLHG